MDVSSPEVHAYLYQLNKKVGSDLNAQVSMYEVGEALGLETDTAAQMAEVLFVGGHAELKTLSGGIGITVKGMQVLGITPVASGTQSPSLSGEPVVTESDRMHIQALLDDIKSVLSSCDGDYESLETLIMDIKTLEVQMLSSAPKAAIVKEIFKSMAQTLPEKGGADAVSRIGAMIGL